MSTAPRRPLGPGRADPPVLPARDPRSRSAAERAAAGEWTAEPDPVIEDALPEERPARRRLGPGPADPGAA
ncbi:hypothetical protein [Streptomyces sp. NPDC058861]|uniref:hypothetical protein n=1 Tax=Streptomyces sp. NPDC058861 TaxID=3346653 RepID=UPI0036763F36